MNPTSIRTADHPVILASTRDSGRETRENIILEYWREVYDRHDPYGSAMELYEATQWLRTLFDSPRIGGGIDAGTRLAGSFADAREECSLLGYIVGSEADAWEQWHLDMAAARKDPNITAVEIDRLCLIDPTTEYLGALNGLPSDYIQDCIVHAEAVAKKMLAQCELAGVDY